MPDKSELFNGLNPSQYEAVVHVDGPLLVVAGAGSGKTRVLTHRIAHLINEGMSPFEILAITFTNKAATEMKDRVLELIGSVAQKMWVSTFHSACVRMLRQDADRLGYPSNFSIYDQVDARRLVSYVIRDLDFDAKKYTPRAIHASISNAKNESIAAEAFVADPHDIFKQRIADVYLEYQRRLLASAAMDFDDLLMNVVELLRKHSDVRQYWQNRFRHVLVDEYQDTNPVQNELVLILGQQHRGVSVVGDGDQSIYAFRGADLRNILDFENAFPDTTTVVLEQNYRSTQSILDAANALIAQNMSRLPKDLWTESGRGDKIIRFKADNEHDEARYVCREIARLHRSEGLRYDEIALFYRTNSQSRVLEDHLRENDIPYQIVGGTRFYDRREIKDAVAYLRAIVNPSDEVSVKRVLNVPKRGVGASSVVKLDDWAKEHEKTFYEALQNYQAAGVGGTAGRGIEKFLTITSEIRDLNASPATILEEALERSGYLEELCGQRSIEAEGRLENISELVGVAREYENVDEFLEKISLVTETDVMDDSELVVTLMTFHAAKGLEFPAVFLTGMEDGVLPHMRALIEPRELEEERRLAYVGVTRAMRLLYLTFAKTRMLNGMTQYNPPSRFFTDIPEELIEDVGARNSVRKRYGVQLHGGTRQHSSNMAERSNSWPRDRRYPQVPPRQTHSKGLALKIGDSVRHDKWGEGVVVDLGGSNNDPEATVNFTTVGQKVLLVAMAPLEKC